MTVLEHAVVAFLSPFVDFKDAEKQKQQNLVTSITQISIANDTNTNGHKENSSDESADEELAPEAATAAVEAATALAEGEPALLPTDETAKSIDPNEPDPANKRTCRRKIPERMRTALF